VTITNAERLAQLAKRHGAICHYCRQAVMMPGEQSRGRFRATVDHVIPLGKGGADDMHNMVIACRPCNKGKANLELGVGWMAVKGRPGGQRIDGTLTGLR
jgi:5-methylcytosine-specific restriction endonuclease McrA